MYFESILEARDTIKCFSWKIAQTLMVHLFCFVFTLQSALCIWPIPGKVKLLLISGKKSASLLGHISKFLKALMPITFSSPRAQPEVVYFLVSNESPYFSNCKSEISPSNSFSFGDMAEIVKLIGIPINNFLCIYIIASSPGLHTLFCLWRVKKLPQGETSQNTFQRSRSISWKCKIHMVKWAHPPLSHQFVTWYLRSISKTKIVKLFCPCMSEHMIYIKNVTNVTQTLHQNVTNVTKQNIASKEILTIEFHTKYMKLFVNMLSVICVLLNTKFHNTSENFYFEVIWRRTIVSCKVTNVTNRYMDFILDLDEEFNFQRPVCLDSNRKY